jgi:ABC-type multidrug transport system fused ATPase/permease subunit
MPPSPDVISLSAIYGASLRRVLRFRGARRFPLSFLVGTALHAGGHAALALAAGECARALGGGGLLVNVAPGAASDPRRSDALSLAILGLAAVLAKAAGGALAAWGQARICGDVGADLRLRVLDGWLRNQRTGGRAPRHPDQGVARNGTITPGASAPSVPLAAMTDHVRELESGLAVGGLGAARAVAQLLPLVAALLWIAPRMAVVAAGAFALFALALGRARRAWRAANAFAMRDRVALLDAADEAVRHAELWTTYGAERRIRAHLDAVGRALAAQGARIEASAATLSGANEVLGAGALVLAIGGAGGGGLGGGGEAALLPFAVTFFLAYRPIRDLTDARLAWARAAVAAEAIAPLVRGEAGDDAAATGRADGEPFPLAPLVLDRVVLARGVASPISLRVAPGSVVAIVGATGSGKTTLVRTLLGLEAPLTGEVRYGDARIDRAAAGPRERPFAWVPQDAPVLADTLDANVAIAEGASPARDALASVGAAHLIEAVGSARLGPAGRALSGGERQWVNLARAVATRQPVLLLDEPTSGLDAANQETVLRAIARLRGERTILLVTHRPEALQIADVVVRLDGSAARSAAFAEGEAGGGSRPKVSRGAAGPRATG